MKKSSNSNQLFVNNQIALLKKYQVFLLLIAYTLLVRFSYLFPQIIDWDESTFILIGQDVLDGNLPFTNLWDMKPPLIYWVFAAFISIFGKSIIGIRIAGSLCISAVAFITYLIVNKTINKKFGLLAGFSIIPLTSIFTGHGAIMSELLAILPLTLALWLLTCIKRSNTILFLVGVVLSVATFVRLSLIFVPFTLGVYFLVQSIVKKDGEFRFLDAFYMAGGFLCLLAVIMLPYVITGNSELFIETVFITSYKYSNSNLGFSASILEHLKYVFNLFVRSNGIGLGFSIFIAILGILVAFKKASFFSKLSFKTDKTIYFLAFIAVEFAMVKSGRVTDHKYLQIAPFLAYFGIIFLYYFNTTYLLKKSYTIRKMTWILFIGIAFIYSLKPYLNASILEERNRPIQKISSYLSKELKKGDTMYLMDKQLLYWIYDKSPPRPSVTHPSILARAELLKAIPNAKKTTEDELYEVLRTRPTYILKPVDVWYFYDHRSSMDLLSSTLDSDYDLVYEVKDLELYMIK